MSTYEKYRVAVDAIKAVTSELHRYASALAALEATAQSRALYYAARSLDDATHVIEEFQRSEASVRAREAGQASLNVLSAVIAGMEVGRKDGQTEGDSKTEISAPGDPS